MTKQERNLIRDAMMFAVKDMTGRVMREATVQSMIDDFEKAINYTHCCKSDSELLPDEDLYQPCKGCTTSCEKWEVFFCKDLVE